MDAGTEGGNRLVRRSPAEAGRRNPHDPYGSQDFKSYDCIPLSVVNNIFINKLNLMLLWVSLGFIGYCWVPEVKVTVKVKRRRIQIAYRSYRHIKKIVCNLIVLPA